MSTPDPNSTLDKRIDETCKLVRQVDLTLAVLVLLSLVFGVLLLAVLADHWLFADGFSVGRRIVIFLGLVGAVGFYSYRRIAPLFLRPINPVYAAKVLEEAGPSLKNSLVNWLLLRRERWERDTVQDKLSERMFDGVTRTAAGNVAQIPSERAVDLRGVARWGIILTVIFLLFVAYGVFSPKSTVQSLLRFVIPISGLRAPQAIHFEDVQPGNVTLQQGKRVTISAKVTGKTAGHEPVMLVFSSDDGQAVKQSLEMQKNSEGRFEVMFPPGKDGLSSGMEYGLQQGSSRSDKFRIEVRPAAAIEVTKLTYRYPAYTGLAEEIVENSGDIRAVEGTEVKIDVRSNLPLQQIDMFLDGKPVLMKLTDQHEATVAVTLKHKDDDLTAATVRSFSFNALDGEGNTHRSSGVFRMEVLPDMPPVVQWGDTDARLQEVQTFEVPLNETLELPVQAEDPDFGLRYLNFHVASPGKHIRPVELLKSPATGPTKHTGPTKATATFSPITSRLNVGDTAEIWIEAVDTKFPGPHSVETRRIDVKVLEPKKQEEAQKEPEEKTGEKEQQENERQEEKTNETKGDESPAEQNQQQNAGQSGGGQSDADQSDAGQSGEGESGESQQNDSAENDGVGGGGTQSEENNSGEGKPDEPQQGGGNNKNNDDKENGNGGENGQNQADDLVGTGGTSASGDKIDPNTQDGDAMEKILEQMKKEGGEKENDAVGAPAGSEEKSGDAQQDTEQSGGESGGGQQNKGGEESGSGESNSEDGRGDGTSPAGAQNEEDSNKTEENMGGMSGGQEGTQETEKESNQSGGGQGSSEDHSNEKDENSAGTPADQTGASSSGQGSGEPQGNSTEPRDGNLGGAQSESEDVPVDPNVNAPRERDNSLDENSSQRSDRGGDSSDPTESNGTGGAENTTPTQKLASPPANDPQAEPQTGAGQNSDLAGTPSGGSASEQNGSESPQKGQSGGKPSGQSNRQSDAPSAPNGNADGGNHADGNASGNPAKSQQSEPTDQTDAGQNSNLADAPTKDSSTDSVPSGGGGSESQQGKDTPTEDANLEYTEKVTNLVLEYLEDQLKNKPNQALLDSLGWTEEELRAFHRKWKRMSEQAGLSKLTGEEIDHEAAWKEALKSLGLRPTQANSRQQRSATEFEDQGNAAEALRYAPPKSLQKRFLRYNEGIGAGR